MTKTTLGDIARRILILVVDVAQDAQAKDRRLQSLSYVMLSSQSAIYWLRLIDTTKLENIAGVIEEGEATTEERIAALHAPTLFGVKDHLAFLDKELKGLTTDLKTMMENPFIHADTLYNLQRAYDKLHDALFQTELSINYYEQLTARR